MAQTRPQEEAAELDGGPGIAIEPEKTLEQKFAESAKREPTVLQAAAFAVVGTRIENGESHCRFSTSSRPSVPRYWSASKGDCVAQAIVEEDCPRKGRKDTETECRPAPTWLDITHIARPCQAPRIPSVFSVLSVVKLSSCPGCGFANG
jgi:hypothetical protein